MSISFCWKKATGFSLILVEEENAFGSSQFQIQNIINKIFFSTKSLKNREKRTSFFLLSTSEEFELEKKFLFSTHTRVCVAVPKLWVVSIIIILGLTLVIFRAEKLCWRGILLLCRNKSKKKGE